MTSYGASFLRSFLWLTVPIALLGWWIFSAEPLQAGGRFTILQINDVYRIEGIVKGRYGGLARLRTLRRQLEAEGPVLMLHAGDMLGPAVMSRDLEAKPMVRALNLLDGDPDRFDPHLVATFGNHEFDTRDPDILLARLRDADFPWVSSNVRLRWPGDDAPWPPSRALDNVHDTLVIPIGGVRVGILGLTLDDVRREWLDIVYEDADQRRDLIGAALDRLKDAGAQVIVAVTHQEIHEDVLMARSFPEIDLVIGGHEHVFSRQRVNDTWITKADADARSVLVIDVRVTGDGKVTALPVRVELGDLVAQDQQVREEVERSMQELESVWQKQDKSLRDKIAVTEHELEGLEPAIRGKETALGNFLADVIRKKLDTDIAFLNGGAVRINDNVPAGEEITRYEWEAIFYYRSPLVSFELTGAQVLDLLGKSVSEAHLAHGRFLQVSGLKFRYRVEESAAGVHTSVRPGEVQVLRGGAYHPLDLEETYSVGTICYLWSNGKSDGYGLFAQGLDGTSPPPLSEGSCEGGSGPELSRAAEAYLDSRKGEAERTITTDVEGRIERLTSGGSVG